MTSPSAVRIGVIVVDSQYASSPFRRHSDSTCHAFPDRTADRISFRLASESMHGWGVFPPMASFSVQPANEEDRRFENSTFPSRSVMTMAEGLCSTARRSFRIFRSSTLFRAVMSVKEATTPTISFDDPRSGAALTDRKTDDPFRCLAPNCMSYTGTRSARTFSRGSSSCPIGAPSAPVISHAGSSWRRPMRRERSTPRISSAAWLANVMVPSASKTTIPPALVSRIRASRSSLSRRADSFARKVFTPPRTIR